MPLQLADRKGAVGWFTELGWIVFNHTDDGFCMYFEENYFKPGTPKNAEFEAMIAHIFVPFGQPKITFWVRFKDTEENRECLRAALSEFYREPLISKLALDFGIKRIRNQILKLIVPRLRG